MNSLQLKAMMAMYPDARFSSHNKGGEEIFDSWVSTSHPAVPIQEDIDFAVIYYQKSDPYIQDTFDTFLAVSRMNDVFTVDERIALMPYLAGIKDYMNYRSEVTKGPRNFADMKSCIAALVSAGVATQAQFDKIKSVLLEQNINLDNY